MSGPAILKTKVAFKKPGPLPYGRNRPKKPSSRQAIGALLYRAVLAKQDTLLKAVGKETIDEIRKKAALERAREAGFDVPLPPCTAVDAPIPPSPAVDAILAAQESARRRQEKMEKKAAQLEERMRAREEVALREKWFGQETKKGSDMTVSLYKSMASGTYEVVVQTNAQSLDVFIGGLSDALHAALVHEASAPNATDNSQAMISATLKNAFPVAFAIAGYKAEKVSESKLLTCGFASPDASELLAQSKT